MGVRCGEPPLKLRGSIIPKPMHKPKPKPTPQTKPKTKPKLSLKLGVTYLRRAPLPLENCCRLADTSTCTAPGSAAGATQRMLVGLT